MICPRITIIIAAWRIRRAWPAPWSRRPRSGSRIPEVIVVSASGSRDELGNWRFPWGPLGRVQPGRPHPPTMEPRHGSGQRGCDRPSRRPISSHA